MPEEDKKNQWQLYECTFIKTGKYQKSSGNIGWHILKMISINENGSMIHSFLLENKKDMITN